jgi:hypothetical protein
MIIMPIITRTMSAIMSNWGMESKIPRTAKITAKVVFTIFPQKVGVQ